jgi:hypothetical protein
MMPRMNVQLLLDSVGYSVDNIGCDFDFTISSPTLTKEPVVISKIVHFNTKKATDFRPQIPVVVDRVVALPSGESTLQVGVKVVEKDEIIDKGSGSGSVKVKPEGTGSGIVKVDVIGKGGSDEGKTGKLNIGFLLVADNSPGRIAELCKVLQAVVGRYGASVAEQLRTCLLRIAWHEGGELRVRAQSNGGPARGVFQMQADGAVAALIAMANDPDDAAYRDFAATGGFADRAALDKSLADLRAAGGTGFGTNAIGGALERSDRCATLAAIYYLRPHFATLPAVSDLAKAAEYWGKYWRRKSTTSANKLFVKESEKLDRIRRQLPLAECGLPPA